jgi:rSAM/selenodomain-associated transferase 2
MELSVIIPTLDEAARLATTLASIPEGTEIVVSDGGSHDDTRAIAEAAGAIVVTGARGRASQMNRGAEAASGDALVFVHADCVLPTGWLEAIGGALSDPDVVGGAFRLRIRNAGLALRLIAFGSNLRARFLRTPYGDQALFVRRVGFEQAGGFPEIPFMEDVAFVRRLRQAGRLALLPISVTTDPRHWERLGPARTTLLNWAAVVLYSFGVPAERLAPLYFRLRSGRRNPAQDRPVAQPD